MTRRNNLRRSELFLVRLWLEEADDGATEWHGKAQRAVSGEKGYFHNSSELLNVLSEMLSASGGPRDMKRKNEECVKRET